jgi:hypothetical protein
MAALGRKLPDTDREERHALIILYLSADERSRLSKGVITLLYSRKAIYAISRYLLQVSYSLR